MNNMSRVRFFYCLMIAVNSFLLGCYASKASTGYPEHFILNWHQWVVAGFFWLYFFIMAVGKKDYELQG